MSHKSSRHHYIPKFLINGFTNKENEVFIYDKDRNIIQANPRPPKSIFWEKDRNTMVIDEVKTSIIEDETYLKLDNFYKKAIETLRVADLNQEHFSISEPHLLHLFVLNLFWRIPATDDLFNKIFDQLKISEHEYSSALRKNERTHIQLLTLKEVIKKNINTRFKYRILEYEKPYFILGDNPTLFGQQPTQLLDLDNLIYIFPICGSRGIVKSLLESRKAYNRDFDAKHVLLYNALTIDQSVRYVISGDKEILEKSLNLYRTLKQKDELTAYKNFLFNVAKF